MATSFGWKKKTGQNVNKRKVESFEKEATDDIDEKIKSGEVDWLTLAPKRRNIQLEDAIIKAKRLEDEGAVLAGAERYWEAISKWDEAISFNPENEKLYDMKAQTYLILHEVYPAVRAAEKVVSMNPRWWIGYQTLGRTQLGLGEVQLALKSFSKAIHINPVKEELWNEDIKWTLSLLEKRKNLEVDKLKDNDITISEIVESSPSTSDTGAHLDNKNKNKDLKSKSSTEKEADGDGDDKTEQDSELEGLPRDYVIMRV